MTQVAQQSKVEAPAVRVANPRRISHQEAMERLKNPPPKGPARALDAILADVKGTLPDDTAGTRHALMQEYIAAIGSFEPGARRQAIQRLAAVFETK